MKTLVAVALLLMGVTGAAFSAVTAVPEIDAGSAVNALALISGAVLVIRGRRKA
ncbi:MAG TPA: hypothetical protein VH640_30010 [Bryobacteraceae bacterium]